DHEVGPDVRPGGQCLVNGVRVPDDILESAAAIVGPLRSTAFDLVRDTLDSGHVRGGRLGEESETKTLSPTEVGGCDTELSGKVLVNEKNVHAKTHGRSVRRS